ncbi:carboxypeptidase-like regulatory domain-containing protein [Maribacter hydrothermalis]|uniref:CarboxypepD_reg-like domain-containing protein n=1 Tax=Maribacter hydrothermalis TaxID=1836467 RepID=A0A1B7ZEN2_9FLAO|nr:carboxypeptidase-like regulatory domain-containing protein [Maribacter hydrothermalis]APQ17533.1 hypothetical protein BTR34_09415 [Maribacter hydrothermalis]OBR42008.1 hypothetical protein A9200_01045 [Maribacter hydrothermalis]
MKHLFYFFTFLICSVTFGQDKSAVQGNILDGELLNEPMLMATVSIENTDKITRTNFRGNFEFDNLSPGEYNLVVQFLGYETIELPIIVVVGKTTKIQAILKAKTLNLSSLTVSK